jgi:hypothetical protein
VNKQGVIDRLLLVPTEIDSFEGMVLALGALVQSAKDELEVKESELLAGTTIDGKNAETRKAQLHQQTESERKAVRDAEDQYAKAQREVRRLYNEFSALRSVTRLLASGDA